jgi:ABC-type ATPase involved in cell division
LFRSRKMGIRLSNVQISYSDRGSPVLDIDSLEFRRGINFIIGNNGSGKSTLLKALSNIHDEVILKGEVELDGMRLNEFSTGMVRQTALFSINLDLTFLENLLLANTNSYQHLSLMPHLTSSTSAKIVHFLQTFSNWGFLSELLCKEARDLSSGQQQMLAILMRVVRFQRLLLLDECTANLDADNTEIIMHILHDLAARGTIVIFATHQAQLLQTIGSECYKIENGEIKSTKNEERTSES